MNKTIALMTLLLAAGALRASAEAPSLDPASIISRVKERILEQKRLPIPQAGLVQAGIAVEPFLAKGVHRPDSHWGRIPPPGDKDFDQAYAQVAKICSRGGDYVPTGKPFEMTDESNEAVVYQICAPQSQTSFDGHSYILVTGSKPIIDSSDSGLRLQAAADAQKDLAAKCDSQGKGIVVGDAETLIVSDQAYAFGVCRYSLEPR